MAKPILERLQNLVLSCQAETPPPPHPANSPNAFLERLGELGFGFSLSPISEDRIRPIAQRLGKQRPWRSDEENWLDAEKALEHAPLGPWIIRFSGEKERSGWEWGELSLKVSVPVMILLAGFLLNYWADGRQERIAREQRENDPRGAREQRQSAAANLAFSGVSSQAVITQYISA